MAATSTFRVYRVRYWRSSPKPTSDHGIRGQPCWPRRSIQNPVLRYIVSAIKHQKTKGIALMARHIASDIMIAGGGLAGIVTALEALRAGKTVTIVDRDTPERLGGLALWAFGGMALIDTPLQRRMKIADSPELALRDWLRFGGLDPADEWPLQWARYYVENARTDVHDWLINEGLTFMPAVNWVERGRFGDGNSVPRYHIVRSEEHTSELQSRPHLVCRLLLEKKKKNKY